MNINAANNVNLNDISVKASLLNKEHQLSQIEKMLANKPQTQKVKMLRAA